MSALVLLTKTSLACYFSELDKPIGDTIPKTVIADMEIQSEDALKEFITKIFGTKPIRPAIQTVLTIGDDLCFSEQGVSEKEQEIKDHLASTLPLSRIATTTLHKQNAIAVVATNMDLYETLVQLLSEKGYVISLVLPWASLVNANLVPHNMIDKSVVKKIMESQNILKQSSFPCEIAKSVEANPSPTTKTSKRSLSKKWIIFIGIAAVYGVTMLIYFLRPH